MNILLLEDDRMQSEEIIDALEAEFGDAVTIQHVETESEFYLNLQAGFDFVPDLAVLDVRVVWAPALPDRMTRPPESEHPDRAGIRCLSKLRERMPKVRAVLFTILEEGDLNGELQAMNCNILQLSKACDDFSELFKVVRNSKP